MNSEEDKEIYIDENGEVFDVDSNDEFNNGKGDDEDEQ